MTEEVHGVGGGGEPLPYVNEVESHQRSSNISEESVACERVHCPPHLSDGCPGLWWLTFDTDSPPASGMFVSCLGFRGIIVVVAFLLVQSVMVWLGSVRDDVVW